MGTVSIRRSFDFRSILKRDRQREVGAVRFGESILHVAARTDAMEVCETLIKFGYNVNAVDDFGQTPLYSAINCGSVEICKILIDAGADVNHQDILGNTPMHKAVTATLDAAFKLNIELLDLLLRSDANINIENNSKETPLMTCYPDKFDTKPDGCYKFPRTKMAKFLIDNGGLLENE